VTRAEIIWGIWNVTSGVASIIGLFVSLFVARQLKAFRKEVLLRSALVDVEAKLRTVAKNLRSARDRSGDAGSDLSVLRAHVVEIREKCAPDKLASEANKLAQLIDSKAPLMEVIDGLAGFSAAVGHYRRDKRWTI
jgi:hypothetical protein